MNYEMLKRKLKKLEKVQKTEGIENEDIYKLLEDKKVLEKSLNIAQ